MKTLSDIDWTRWEPEVRATLLFIWRDDALLLIRKKRGLGAGKINGPGGKIDPGEGALEAAERELWEELGVRAQGTVERGELSFQFTDGLRLHVQVFTAPDCTGQAIETDEAIPLWTPTSAIPYDEMWADDRVWLPHMLAGRRFALRALFDDDTMLDHDIKLG
ncbi:MAG: 8-oxo-dGTP diphosphatase [Myxococcota bacterium]|jgi:8-oxo-dGTP diphosphatase